MHQSQPLHLKLPIFFSILCLKLQFFLTLTVALIHANAEIEHLEGATLHPLSYFQTPEQIDLSLSPHIHSEALPVQPALTILDRSSPEKLTQFECDHAPQ